MMDRFPIPNRERRKSNLGRRKKYLPNHNPPRLVPIFQDPVPRGLGRSAKKLLPQPIVPKTSNENLFAKKRLFLLSPPNPLSSSLQVATSKAQSNPPDMTLNETGVQVLVSTPSPDVRCDTSQGHSWKQYPQQPRSPQLSHYRQLLSELADLKPPMDPDDLVVEKESSAGHSAQYHLKLPSNSKEDFGVSSPVIDNGDNHDLDTTDAFITAEQTIVDQNETLTEVNDSKFLAPVSISKSVLKPSKCLESVSEEETESDNEDELLKNTLSKLNLMTAQLNTMMGELNSTTKLVQSIINKKRKRQTEVANKENNTNTANQPVKNRWMSEFKSEHPGLLKTPKPANKLRMSLAEQSLIWTPHSLSTVLNDQVDELFE